MPNENLLKILHDDVIRAPSGREPRLIAELVGKPYPTLMGELNTSEPPHHKLGVEMLVPLMQQTGSVRPIHHLARLFNGVFIPLPRERRSLKESHLAAIRAAAEFGDVMRRFDDALDEDSEDGAEMTEAEFLALEREAHEAHTAMTAFIEAARAEVEKRLGRAVGREAA